MQNRPLQQFIEKRYFDSLRKVVLSLGVVYLLLGISHLFVMPEGPGKLMSAFALFTALVMCYCQWRMKSSHWMRSNVHFFLLMVVILLPTANVALHIGMIPESRQTTNFLLILLASGILMLDTRWLVWSNLLVTAIWAGIFAYHAFPGDDWVHYGYAMMLAFAVSVVTNVHRVRNTRQMEASREAEQTRNRELRKVKKELESRAAELRSTIGELERARDKAEAAGIAKQEFLSNMSHELRTPLNSVIGFAQLLIDTNPRKDQLDNLETLRFSAANLLELINKLLDFTKIEANKYELHKEPVSVRELMVSIGKSFEKTATDKRISLETVISSDLPEFLLTDRLALYQIASNLLSNAMKFTETGFVRLTASYTDQKLKIAVVDSGIGMTEAQCSVVFDPFRQADSKTTRTHGGTGLGLAITKRLVELLQGSIELESELGEGSRFDVQIPVMPTESPKSRTGRSGQRILPEWKGRRVLLVDDNEINLKLMKRMLNAYGLEVTCARDGSEAITTYDSAQFELVLMDIQMPVMDGLDATREIRKRPLHSDRPTPVVALTAYALEEDGITEIDSLFDAHLVKPVERQLLENCLEQFLQTVPG